MKHVDRTPTRERFANARLYLCVDARRHLDAGRPGFPSLRQLVHDVCEGGCDIVQLRDKASPGEKQFGALTVEQQLEALDVMTQAAAEHNALVSVNDRMDLAVAANAPVAHVGQDDIPTEVARQILGPTTILGLSCHTTEQVDAAIANPFIDYFCTGPIWATPTKPGRPGVGLELVRYAAQQMDNTTPWFAIGGIKWKNLDQVVEAGAQRIVVVRALTDAENPTAAARLLRDRLGFPYQG